MTTTDTPTPLTPLDERRLAVLSGVVKAVCVDGRTAAIETSEVQALADWVLGAEERPDIQAEAAQRYTSARAHLNKLLAAKDEAPAPAPHVWSVGDVVRLKEPSLSAGVARVGLDGWRVADRGEVDGSVRVLDRYGCLRLRHDAIHWGIDRLPEEVTLVASATASS